ncbi:MAG TPA: hypothetical protein VNW52_01355 [Burkholderiaceae bacterium]|jgi:hypothetical protein|nr:hypothetical protein [Burkholderiaceae bacterium]
MTFIFMILVIIGLPLWLWLASRISQVNNTGALLSLILVIPAFYWVYKLWNNRRADLRIPAIANLVVNFIAMPALVVYSTHYATNQIREESVAKDNPQMNRWCQEQNDAIYDPVLKVCVEPTKADILTMEKRDNLMGQLEQTLNQRGLAGELDRSATPEIDELKKSPDVADAANFKLSPATSAPLQMLLCLSESACTHLVKKQKRDGSTALAIGKGKLMLLIAPDSVTDGQIKKIKTAVANFTPN